MRAVTRASARDNFRYAIDPSVKDWNEELSNLEVEVMDSKGNAYLLIPLRTTGGSKPVVAEDETTIMVYVHPYTSRLAARQILRGGTTTFLLVQFQTKCAMGSDQKGHKEQEPVNGRTPSAPITCISNEGGRQACRGRPVSGRTRGFVEPRAVRLVPTVVHTVRAAVGITLSACGGAT